MLQVFCRASLGPAAGRDERSGPQEKITAFLLQSSSPFLSLLASLFYFFGNSDISCQINQIWVISCQKSPAKSYLKLFSGE